MVSDIKRFDVVLSPFIFLLFAAAIIERIFCFSSSYSFSSSSLFSTDRSLRLLAKALIGFDVWFAYIMRVLRLSLLIFLIYEFLRF